jgi:hypothetical protein
MLHSWVLIYPWYDEKRWRQPIWNTPPQKPIVAKGLCGKTTSIMWVLGHAAAYKDVMCVSDIVVASIPWKKLPKEYRQSQRERKKLLVHISRLARGSIVPFEIRIETTPLSPNLLSQLAMDFSVWFSHSSCFPFSRCDDFASHALLDNLLSWKRNKYEIVEINFFSSTSQHCHLSRNRNIPTRGISVSTH